MRQTFISAESWAVFALVDRRHKRITMSPLRGFHVGATYQL